MWLTTNLVLWLLIEKKKHFLVTKNMAMVPCDFFLFPRMKVQL